MAAEWGAPTRHDLQSSGSYIWMGERSKRQSGTDLACTRRGLVRPISFRIRRNTGHRPVRRTDLRSVFLTERDGECLPSKQGGGAIFL